MSRDEIVQRIRDEAKRAGSLRKLAKRWGVSAAYLSDIQLGRRNPGPGVLAPLGLVAHRHVTVEYTYEHSAKGRR